MSEVEDRQPLVEHLGELRDRLIKCAYAIFICGIIAWFFTSQIFDLIRLPIEPYLTNTNGGLIFTHPMDKFMAHVKIAMLTGLILACPVWLYQLWRFVAPGLYAKEQKYAAGFIISGTVLFMSGVLFVYYLVLPAAFKFLLGFGGDLDKPLITIEEYLSFFITTTLVFGASFELPLVLVLLGLIGIVDAKMLRKNRRYAIVILAAVSAVVTPPDMLSMIMLLVPLLILYEISILIVAAFARKSQNANKTS
jgi:sec-independent protein translocase protein TatC